MQDPLSLLRGCSDADVSIAFTSTGKVDRHAAIAAEFGDVNEMVAAVHK